MAYRGPVKPKYWWVKSRPILWIGLLCGFGLGGAVTQQVYRFKNSGSSTWSREVSETGNLVWQVLTFPASLIRGIPTATEATPGELSFVLVTNGLLVGAIGATIGWQIEKRRKRGANTEIQSGLLNERLQTIICKRAARGFIVGFAVTASLMGVSLLISYGAFWAIGWLLFAPTAAICKLVGYTWPTYAVPTLWQTVRSILVVSVINGALVGILYGSVNGVRKLMKR
jgi:hypothetical protein